MQKNKKIYNIYQKASAIFMMLCLVWLTISTPFVLAFQQELAKMEKASHSQSPISGGEEEAGNPLNNTTEEKTPNMGSNFSEEYLHEHHSTDYIFAMIFIYNKYDNADTYHAYHGELLVPPPNAS